MKLLRLAAKGIRILVWRVRLQGLPVTFTWAWTRLYLWTVGRPVLHYCRITPDLYVGGQMNGRGWRWLAARGLTASLNMRSEFDDAVCGVDPAGYLWLPTDDDHAPTPDHLRRGVAFIRHVVENGGKVYVHCASGVGRAPTMAAAYLVSTGLSLDEAWALIRKTRPFVKPTPPQRAALEQFAREEVQRLEHEEGQERAKLIGLENKDKWLKSERFT
jgi:protein tyrosine phosphatase (PTP) superfamily phosphohydrolase (DUF442 family)